MDVKFTTTTKAKLDSLPITNGQLIYLSDSDECYYDMSGSRHPMSGVWLGTTLPASATGAVIYIVITSDLRAILYVWDDTEAEFVQVTSGMDFQVLTAAQYKALPASAKTAEHTYFIKDANSPADLT